jgi:hypothetical protein
MESNEVVKESGFHMKNGDSQYQKFPNMLDMYFVYNLN